MAKSREQYIWENSEQNYDQDLISFSLIDEDTIKRREREGDITTSFMHTRKYLDIEKDKRWNTKQLNSKLLAGILNGDSIPKIAQSFIDVIGNNESAAMRNARTMITQAECGGRQDSYENLAEQGVVQKKVWIATPDDRTRESHLDIDGEEVDIDDSFSNGCAYPADPAGDGSETYNCRCSIRTHIIGFMRPDGTIVEIGAERDTTMHERQMQEEKERRGIESEEKTETKTPLDITIENLKAAYDYHTKYAGLTRTSAKELDDLGIINANLGKFSEKTQDAISSALNGLISEYDTPLSKVRTMTKEEFFENDNSFAFVYHDYTTGVATMVYNPAKVKEYDALIERLQGLKEDGYIPQIDDTRLGEYVTTHEFAHTFFDMETKLRDSKNWVGEDYDKIRSVRKDINAIYNEYAEKIGKLEEQKGEYELQYLMGGAKDEALADKAIELEDQIAKIKISDYSMVNADEFMAEAFTHSKLDGSPNAYAKRVMDVINNNFKR